MDLESLNWKISAKAGEGVMSSAKLFAKACKKQGLAVFNYYEYPSLIKGGLQSGQVRAALRGATCQRRFLDLLIVFHEKFILDHLAELNERSLVVVNANAFDASKYPELKAKVIAINLTKIARDQGANPLSSNIAALGLSACLFGMDLEVMGRVVIDEFARSKEAAVKDLAVLKTAFEITQQFIEKGELQSFGKLISTGVDEQLLMTGSEAIGLGALAAGLQFYSAYPMTPSTGILHYLAARQNDYPIVVKHAEDELGAINHAIGAAFAGVRAMTGSSGGGFALMVESLSFAGVAEVPLVVVEAVRQGPATGLPTWTSQGDLNFILSAGHGEFLRVVLTPGDVEEHYKLAKLAVELAEKYQLPVLIMSDKYILESHQSMPKMILSNQNARFSMLNDGKLGETGLVDGEYLRYKSSENGISLRSIPGQTNALQLTNSYEHDEYGFATEDAVTTKEAVDKRAAKLESLRKDLPKPLYLGSENPEKILISFGSTVNVLREVLLDEKAKNIAAIHLPCICPFPTLELEELLKDKKAELFVLEGDSTGQLAALIKKETSLTNLRSILRYDGRPFYSEDILEFLGSQKLNEQYRLI
ncbi:2-oxoacid:acceptor oxidoreductase subunit alpha [Patescibacteria group bacterium]|nr:2-oxoacid:acceptor oxidoreductase subunit alpha [Patescibacteria group bacterium]